MRAGSLLYVILGVVTPATILWATFLYYLTRKNRNSLLVVLVAWVCWFLPLSVLLLLPLDLASTLYRQCMSNSLISDCDKPLVYVPRDLQHLIWRIVYWTSFVLSWFCLPFLNALATQGCLPLKSKVAGALRCYFKKQLGLALAGTALVSYLVFTKKFDFSILLSGLMLLSNVYGLILVVIFMGQGLTRIPKNLWAYASPRQQLQKKLYPAVPRYRESYTDNEVRWKQVCGSVCEAFQRSLPAAVQDEWHDAVFAQKARALRFSFCRGPNPVVLQIARQYELNQRQQYVMQLAIFCYAEVLHLMSQSRNHGAETAAEPLENGELHELYNKVHQSFLGMDKSRARWHRLLLRIWWLEDCIGVGQPVVAPFWQRRDGMDDPDSLTFADNRFSSARPDVQKRAMTASLSFCAATSLRCSQFFVVWARPIIWRIAALLCAAISLILLWSELTFPFTTTNSLTDPENNSLAFKWNILAYGMSWLAKGSNVLDTSIELGRISIVQIASLVIVAYMCLCSFTSLFKLRLFGAFSLQGPHHSDEHSMLFVGAFLCRIMFPLAWNFLMMIGDQENTEFTKFMGKSNLMALFGSKLQTYLPVLIAIFFVNALFSLHSIANSCFRNLLGLADLSADYDDGFPNEETESLLPAKASLADVGQRIARRERKQALQRQRLYSNQLARSRKRQHSQDFHYNRANSEKNETCSTVAFGSTKEAGSDTFSVNEDADSCASPSLDDELNSRRASANKLWEWSDLS